MLKSLETALNANNSVTLPNFGGFMKIGNSYMFNEFLKFNDGKFSKFLQETENLNEQDATTKIESFIVEIQSTLDSKGSFSLNNIGTLVIKDGKIKLEKVIEATPKESTKTPTKAQKKELPKETPIVKEIPIKKVEPKKEKKTEIPTLKVIEKKKDTLKLSKDYTVKEALEKIDTLNDKQDIIDFTKGDSRKTIITSLNLRLKSLNKITPPESLETELNILEATQVKKETSKSEKEIPIKEGSKKEVKKQVAKESDILKTVIEKEKSQKISEENPVKKKETPKKVEKSEPFIEKKVETPKTEVKSQKLSEEKKPKKNKITKEEEDLVALTEGAVKLEKEAKGRKRNKIILWVAIICILSGGGIVTYLKQDVIIGWFGNTELIAENEEIIPEESETVSEETPQKIAEEETIEEEATNIIEEIPEEEQSLAIEEELTEEVIEEKIEPIKESSVQPIKNDKYYAVVGSFSKGKNALNLVKSLKKEGFSNASIFQNNNLQSVTLGIYTSSAKAKQILRESGKDGWVKKPR